ncbi:MAG: hypothetical protein R6U21_04770 [Thermoplasmatota archaeon]
MTQKLRPTPVLKGKAARKFYQEINDGKISSEQKQFLGECVKLINESR